MKQVLVTTLGLNVVLAYESTPGLSALVQCARSQEHVMRVFSGKRREIARLHRGCRSVMIAASMLSHAGAVMDRRAGGVFVDGVLQERAVSAIRDALVRVASPPGLPVLPGAEGIRAGLEAVRDGNDVNYEGAATTLDWNADGDVTNGYVGIWAYIGGAIVEQAVVPFVIQ